MMKLPAGKEGWEKLIDDNTFIMKVCDVYSDIPFIDLKDWEQEILMDHCRNWLIALKESL